MARPPGPGSYPMSLLRGRFSTKSGGYGRRGRIYTFLHHRVPRAAVSFYVYDDTPNTVYPDAFSHSHELVRVRFSSRPSLVAMLPAVGGQYYRLWLGPHVDLWPGNRYRTLNFDDHLISWPLDTLRNHYGVTRLIAYHPDKLPHEQVFEMSELASPIPF